MTKSRSKYISIDKAAEILNFTPGHVRHLLRAGEIQGDKIGRDWLLLEKSLKGKGRKRAKRKPKDEGN